MKKRPKKSTLNNALDRLISLQVREANNHLCEVCGGPANQVHHVVKRRASMRVRFDARNLVSICPGCHMWAEGWSLAVKGGHAKFHEWFAANRPEDAAYLDDPENTKVINRSVPDLMDLLEEMKRAA